MGKLFVIDGTDGSGKQTQLERLKNKFEENGIAYKLVSFPNYNSPSSSLVKMYLSGEFGENAKDVSPYIASTFFAADRYATYKKDYEEYYKNGGDGDFWFETGGAYVYERKGKRKGLNDFKKSFGCQLHPIYLSLIHI